MINGNAANRKAKHRFSFAGGDILRAMGASWFVSYAYYVHVDQSQRNWSRKTQGGRVTRFNATVPYHLYWLDKIDSMDDGRLATNRIGLTPAEVKEMAKKVLKKFW